MKLKQSLRNITKNKVFSIVNILGLSLSICFIIYLLIYINNETGVEQNKPNSDKIYRVLISNKCTFSPPFGQYLTDNVNTIETFCRTFSMEAVLKSENNLLTASNCFFVDSNFFQLFDIPLKNGNISDVLKTNNSVVVSSSFAKKMFGDRNPIGEVIKFKNRLDFIVSGVVDDFGYQTHFKNPEVLFPFNSLNNVWGSKDYLSQYDWKYFLSGLYVKTSLGFEPEPTAKQVHAKVNNWYWLFNGTTFNDLKFQPITECYLNPYEYAYSIGAREGNQRLIKILVMIVMAIIVITIINYLNLTLSQSLKRIDTFNIKKLVGANKLTIFIDALFESSIFLMISFIVSGVLVFLFVSPFEYFTNYKMGFSGVLIALANTKILIYILLFSVVACIIPAFVVSQFAPNKISKTASVKFNVLAWQKGLVTGQYTISVVLIIAMIGIQKQNNFLKEYEVGFNQKQTMFVKLNSDIKKNKLAFVEEVKKVAGVQNASLCNGMPGVGIMKLEFEKNGENMHLDFIGIDENYFNVMDIAHQKEFINQYDICYLNKSAAKLLNYNESEGSIKLNFFGTDKVYKVHEILDDLHFHSLYKQPQPAIFTVVNPKQWVDYVLIKIDEKSALTTIQSLKTVYSQFSKNFPFNYAFLDDTLNKAYKQEAITSELISLFTLLVSVISALGIFALSRYSSERRIKEIGIRKINGAKTFDVVKMLNQDFIKWVMIAIVIASPIAYYAMNKWLEGFAYKTSLSWWIFVLAGTMALIIALATVSWQSWRAATRNPVETLRYE